MAYSKSLIHCFIGFQSLGETLIPVGKRDNCKNNGILLNEGDKPTLGLDWVAFIMLPNQKESPNLY